MNPPRSCKRLSIISETQHPSYRHSVIDWSDPQQATSHGFGEIEAVETILRQGEVLYLPSFWFHYIVSLEYSVQCNSRSGLPLDGQGESEIEDCMGKISKKRKKKKKQPEQ